jgi:hypothetical protein
MARNGPIILTTGLVCVVTIDLVAYDDGSTSEGHSDG